MKKLFVVFLAVAFVFVLGGCMENNILLEKVDENEIKSEMMSYASEKYNQSFDEKDFYLATRGLDANNHDVLVLEDDHNVVFNVFSSTDKKNPYIYDDYAISTADKAFSEFFVSNSGAEVHSEASLIADSQLEHNDIKDLSAQEIAQIYNLSSLIVVVKIDSGSLQDSIEEIYNIYSLANSFNPNYIDFEVIRISGNNLEIDKMLSDMRLNYENDWNSYSGISQTLVVKEKNLEKDVLLSMIEEV